MKLEYAQWNISRLKISFKNKILQSSLNIQILTVQTLLTITAQQNVGQRGLVLTQFRSVFPFVWKLSSILQHSGLILENKGCVRYNQKEAINCSKRAQLWIFTPYFSKFRAFRTLHSPKQHVFLEFLVKNNAFHFSKRALRASTTWNNLLKKALVMSRSSSIDKKKTSWSSLVNLILVYN